MRLHQQYWQNYLVQRVVKTRFGDRGAVFPLGALFAMSAVWTSPFMTNICISTVSVSHIVAFVRSVTLLLHFSVMSYHLSAQPNTDMTIAWINYETKVANIQDS